MNRLGVPMLLRRLSQHIRDQNWIAVALDFLIVVSGVFIGIQAANWNERSALIARSEAYNSQLLIDLRLDAETGQRGVISANEIDAAADLVLGAIAGEEDALSASDGELVSAFVFAGYAYIPRAASATYSEMISVGALGSIDDADFKRQLANYYSRMEAAAQWNVLLRDEQMAYNQAIRGVLSREQSRWARASYAEEAPTIPENISFDRQRFLDELRSRPSIVDSLQAMGALQQRLRDESLELEDRAEQLATVVRAQMND